MAADAQAILRRYQERLGVRVNWDRTRQDIADYVLPAKSDIIWHRMQGARKTQLQLDSEAERAAHRLAATMLTVYTSPAQKWFGLRTREQDLNDEPEVMTWLDACADAIYAALGQSNFYAEVGELWLDLVVMGTGCTLTEELAPTDPPRFGGFVFHTYPFGRYVIAEGPTGTVDTIYRRFAESARNLVTRWPEAVPREVTSAVEHGRPDQTFDLIHAVYPRPARDRGRAYGARGNAQPYASCYVMEHPVRLLHESGFRENPYVVPRWTKASGEEYGRGLGDQAYGDIRTLNRYVELDLNAGEKAVDPAHEVVKDWIEQDQVDLRPAASNWVNRPGAIVPIQPGANFQVSIDRIERLRTQIRETFFHSSLVLAAGGPAETATEVRIKYELMLRHLGSVLPRIQSEGMTPLIARCFSMMYRAGALPPVPDVLLQRGADLDVQYEGPLSRAQRAQDAEAVARWVAELGQIAQARPEVYDNINVDKTARLLADVLGVPPDLVQDPQVMAQVRQIRIEQVQQQKALAATTEIGKAAGPASRMLTAVHDASQTPPAETQPEAA